MEDCLFRLLRIGLETEMPSAESLRVVASLKKEEWAQLGELADKQGVLAIVLDGIERLKDQDSRLTMALPQDALLEWIGEVMMIEQANQHQMAVMNDLAEKWTKAGCRVMVMKGQANGTFYPKPEHRSPGDIDCYLFEDYARGNEIAREAGAEVDEGWYKHSQIHYQGEMFENHLFLVTTRNGRREKLIEKELEQSLGVDISFYSSLSDYVICPPILWTAMFLTYHSCSHFISEGLRLKQLLDWAMFLRMYQDEVDWKRFYDFCERHHLRRFADAATAICVEHLGIKITNPAITTTSPYSERILHSALYDNDYVFGSGEGSWHNRWHLIRNLFHYRWKHKEIYESSPWTRLWYYVTGYFFKTE